MIEKLVNGHDVFHLQPKGSGIFESFASGASDNQSQCSRDKTVSQIDVLSCFRTATAASGEAGQTFFFQNRVKSRVKQTEQTKHS